MRETIVQVLQLGLRDIDAEGDLDRNDWRTFRVDRIRPHTPSGSRFTPRPVPADTDLAAREERAVGEAVWRFRARVIVHAPASYVRQRLPIQVDIETLGDDHCAFEPGSDNPQQLALYLGMLDADFEIVDSPELAAALRTLIERYQRALPDPATPSPR
ncbi:WYL domain-containing protein [Nocardia sp. SYP-A9097]|uniref:helix-turn-helix transcriptional regulator n=1 Tax=Nocardia sp. SYP-A9097 TaxID=2663237 RepID=UPI001326AFE0|nr:WYL domain-containing protein [Nocardia sp. SYP-A9097]MRH88498.1 WYL domain-containing protein [Nocardia sp. SYP-A9097]